MDRAPPFEGVGWAFESPRGRLALALRIVADEENGKGRPGIARAFLAQAPTRRRRPFAALPVGAIFRAAPGRLVAQRRASGAFLFVHRAGRLSEDFGVGRPEVVPARLRQRRTARPRHVMNEITERLPAEGGVLPGE